MWFKIEDDRQTVLEEYGRDWQTLFNARPNIWTITYEGALYEIHRMNANKWKIFNRAEQITFDLEIMGATVTVDRYIKKNMTYITL